MKRSRTHLRRSTVWIACAALPLALIGCGGNRNATTATQPNNERVAGERQEEPSAEVRAAMQQGGLPERFVFGGRTWLGHEIHRVERNKVAETAEAARAGNPPGPASANQSKPQEGQNPFDFTPVADLQVQGHQIYRKAGLDEAVTDNIFLMASSTGMGTGTTGTTGTGTTGSSTEGTGTTGATGTNAGDQNQVMFIEYDAVGDTSTMDLNQALQATGLPMTIQHGGKTFTAREVQLYDPDVFDDYGKAQSIQGHNAYMDSDKRDELVLMGEPSPGMGTTGTGTTGTGTGTPGTGTGSTGTGTSGTGMSATGETSAMSGPLFIRYEEGASAGGTGSTEPGRTP